MFMPTIHVESPFQRGQRFLATDPAEPAMERELVVDRLVRDQLGMLHVVLRTLDGREISLFADQLEAAVGAGWFVASEPMVVATA